MTIHGKLLFKSPQVSVIALQSIEFKFYQVAANAGSAHGRCESVAVVVCDANGDYALDMNNNVMSVEELRSRVPALDSIVNPLITPHTLPT